ncbi:MAG: Maf family protein [Mariprofundales bacterium]|nr:Maf family protein [Mariprofundales bacterium]
MAATGLPLTIGDRRVVLASRSPRRSMLLERAGFTVEVHPSNVDETVLPNEGVHALVARLCRAKAAACDWTHLPVIAADTVVSIDDHILGQPEDLAQAASMLAQLSGRSHRVLTGVCVGWQRHYLQQVVATEVRFRSLSSEEIAGYLLHNMVLDKAGGYAIQEGAASFIEAIDGPLDNVMGLPVQATLRLLAEGYY